MKKNFASLLLCVFALILPARAWTIININTNTITNYFQLATNINGNNNEFTGWLDADDVTNSYFYNVITNLNPLLTNTLPLLLAQTNRLNAVIGNLNTVSNNFLTASNQAHYLSINALTNFGSGYSVTGILSGQMNFDAGLITSDGSSGILTVHHTGNYGDPTGGGRIQGDNSPVNSSDPNNINFIGPNQDDGGSGGYDMLLTADRMLDFHANGYTIDNTSIHFGASGRCHFDTGDFSLGPIGFAVDAPGVPGGVFFVDGSGTGDVGINNTTPAYLLDVAGSMGDSVDGGWNIDSSGNITCLSLTQTSDQNTKTNFSPVNTAAVLAGLQALAVSNWNFKDRTITVTNLQAGYSSNAVVVLRTNAHGSILSRTNWVKVAGSTNAFVRTRTIPAGGRHIGPMAQAWSAQFGGSTNGINVTDAIGVLLAGEQELAGRSVRSSTNGSVLPLKSPNGTVWYVKVSDAGQLSASQTP